MAAANGRRRSAEAVRREIEAEREELARAVAALRTELGAATDVTGKLKGKLPLVAAGATALGFVAAGGIGATARLVLRQRREGTTRARLGRFALVDRS